MMATKAVHGLGDISRPNDDLCVITDEDGDNYIGNWMTGFGFVSVKFPKSTTRPLTTDEVDHYHGMPIGIGDAVFFLNLKDENFIKPITLFKNGKQVFVGQSHVSH